MIRTCYLPSFLTTVMTTLLLQLFLTVNLSAAFQRIPTIEKEQAAFSACRRLLNDRPHKRNMQLSSSQHFLELETERVFQLYMKSRVDMKHYTTLEQGCHDDDDQTIAANRHDHTDKDGLLMSSIPRSEEIPCVVREHITERDRRSFDKWRAIIASLKDEEARASKIAPPNSPFSLPSSPFPTQPKFLAVPAGTTSTASLPYPSYTMLHDIPDDDYII